MADKNDLREEMLSQGTSWLLEAEFLNTPQAKNFLYLNTYNASTDIKDADILVDSNSKALLVYIELGWWGRFRRKQAEIAEYLMEQYANILPSYRVRVVYDRRIFDLALKRAQEQIKGGTSDEKPITSPRGKSVSVQPNFKTIGSETSRIASGSGPNTASSPQTTTQVDGQGVPSGGESSVQTQPEVQPGLETGVISSESGVESPQGPTKLPQE